MGSFSPPQVTLVYFLFSNDFLDHIPQGSMLGSKGATTFMSPVIGCLVALPERSRSKQVFQPLEEGRNVRHQDSCGGKAPGLLLLLLGQAWVRALKERATPSSLTHCSLTYLLLSCVAAAALTLIDTSSDVGAWEGVLLITSLIATSNSQGLSLSVQ